MVSQFKMQRTLKNLSQSELGKIVGLSQPYINQIELLKVEKVSTRTGERLAAALGKPIDKLLEIAE